MIINCRLLKIFSKAGYILPLYENDDLGKILKDIKSFKPKKKNLKVIPAIW